MFETSQQEESSSTAKIIGGVVAVVAVILVVVYFLVLHEQQPAGTATGAGTSTSSAAADTGETPDPLRDLRIVRSNLRRDQTQTMAMWDIIVANRSRSVGYKNIQYATNYYNASDTVIYHNEGTLSEVIEPGDQHTFEAVNDGLYPVGTARYTIEIKGAEAVQ